MWNKAVLNNHLDGSIDVAQNLESGTSQLEGPYLYSHDEYEQF